MLPDPLHRTLPDIIRGTRPPVYTDGASIWIFDDLFTKPTSAAKPPPRVPSPAVVLALRGGVRT